VCDGAGAGIDVGFGWPGAVVDVGWAGAVVAAGTAFGGGGGVDVATELPHAETIKAITTVPITNPLRPSRLIINFVTVLPPGKGNVPWTAPSQNNLRVGAPLTLAATFFETILLGLWSRAC
jgi:hypothetical protein